MGMAILLLVLGLVVLVVGAEALVRGASGLALRLGISPLVVGLTIVAFGTSSPELTVSLGASLSGQPDIAVGNVVGSNIFNVLLILGVSALITPLAVHHKLVRVDVPIMIAISGLFWLMALDGWLGRIESVVLVTGLVLYTALAIFLSRREKPGQDVDLAAPPFVEAPEEGKRSSLWLQLLLIAGGLGLCVLGARWLVNGAVTIATALGVSTLIIGLTIVAAGTSLPEVATSIVAAIRGERDIAVGNVVGSNIFNILCILGISGVVAPLEVPAAALAFDIPVMTAVAVVCLPIFFTGSEVRRWEGAVLLAYYAVYIAFLTLAATGHPALESFRYALVWFVIPLTILGIAFSVLNALRTRRRRGTTTG